MKFMFRANLPLILILLTVLIALCGVPNVAAQEVASLTGVVTDGTGAVAQVQFAHLNVNPALTSSSKGKTKMAGRMRESPSRRR